MGGVVILDASGSFGRFVLDSIAVRQPFLNILIGFLNIIYLNPEYFEVRDLKLLSSSPLLYRVSSTLSISTNISVLEFKMPSDESVTVTIKLRGIQRFVPISFFELLPCQNE